METVDNILTLRPPHSLGQDSLLWTPDPRGAFSVKGAVLFAQQRRLIPHSLFSEQDLCMLWRLRLQDRLKLLL